MAIRTEVYERIGGFDSDFFCYMEDVDLSFRARLMGERVLFSPNIKVYHHGFGSTEEKKYFFPLLWSKKRVSRLLEKYASALCFTLYTPSYTFFLE
nr:hypothetical protein A9P81_4009 [Leptospira interrogans serovar Copenhageni/Icterohaemorrhagiae]